MKLSLLFSVLCAGLLAAAPTNAATKEVGPIVSNVVAELTDAATISMDASVAFTFHVTLGGNRTLATPSNAVAGSLYTLLVDQDGTGSRTLAFGSGWRFPGATSPTLTTNANAKDVLLFVADGSAMNMLSVIKDLGAPITPPSGLTATNNQVGQVTLNWVDNSSDEDGFEIQIDSGGFGHLDDVAAGVTTYVDPEVAGDYTYRIRAKRGGSFSTPSNSATGTAL